MSLIEVKPIQEELVSVDYLGGTILVPANHEFVAMTKLDCSNGEAKGLLVSFEVEPTVSRNGYYIAVPGTEHRILTEVEYQDPRGTLRRVQGHDRDDAILSNVEELVYKMTAVLEQAPTREAAIHALFCPEHGIVLEFLHSTTPMLADYFSSDEDDDEDEPTAHSVGLDPEPEYSPRVVNMTGKTVPEDVMKQLLGLLALAAKADGIGRT